MSQPANTDISVFRTVRSYRQNLLHGNVAALIKRLRPLVMSVPGEEVQSGVLTRDTSLKDTSPYMGEARHDATRGFPIVVGLLPTKTYAEAQEGLSGIDFGFQIGQDWFLHSSADNLDNDLHEQLRDL